MEMNTPSFRLFGATRIISLISSSRYVVFTVVVDLVEYKDEKRVKGDNDEGSKEPTIWEVIPTILSTIQEIYMMGHLVGFKEVK